MFLLEKCAKNARNGRKKGRVHIHKNDLLQQQSTVIHLFIAKKQGPDGIVVRVLYCHPGVPGSNPSGSREFFDTFFPHFVTNEYFLCAISG